MSNPNSFTKFRLLSLIAAGLLFLWFFFDANLSRSVLLKDLGLQDSQILSYILVALLFFFLLESILEFNKARGEGGWQSQFQLIWIIVFSLSALLTSYPKLVLNTVLHDTTRKDLIIPIVTAVITSVGAIYFRIFFEAAQIFYKFRKRLLPSHWIELSICGFVILFGIVALSLLSSGSLPTKFITRHIVFIMSFICFFFTFAPKRKLYDENQLAVLSKKSNYLDRKVEISEHALSSELIKKDYKKKLHKKTMRIIERQCEEKCQNLKPRFMFLKEVRFKPAGNLFEPQLMDEEEKVLRVDLLSKDQGEVLKSVDVKFKYLQSACKEINRPNNENDLRSFLTPMALKAYSLHIFNESDPNELLFEISNTGDLNRLKELITKRNPDINYIVPERKPLFLPT